MKTWIGTAALGIALLAAGTAVALAQAGSTGGTLGNTDKSISGERREESPSQQKSPELRPRKKASEGSQGDGCESLAGSWTWKWLSESVRAVLRPDGTATRSDGVSGNWSCSGSAVTVTRSAGGPDRLTLSPNGKRLSGTGTFGIAVTGIRN
jgi:hypothetical protein